jgi:uncharacterized protein YecE (DUF72 family)
MIYIGTSGFSYDDWVGPYYPQDLKKTEWLSFYAREFSTLELNSSYYGIPTAFSMERMAAKTPDGFQFTVKAHQDMTHKRTDNEAVFTQFAAALSPLIEQSKFGCILAQFPTSFHNTPDAVDYLKLLRERLGEMDVVVEVRNRDWLSPETFDFLRRQRLGFCCVDEPRFSSLMPPVAEATSDVAYVRFHGRNAKKWWNAKEPWERYDYTYRPEELQEWAPKLQELAESSKRLFVFANNHYRGQAIDTARQLRFMLPAAG